MVAGAATLRTLTREAYAKLDQLTKRLGEELDQVFEEAEVEAQVSTAGSLVRVHFLPNLPRTYREAAKEDDTMHLWFSFWLLNHGIHGSLNGNLSLPMEETHVDQLVSTVRAGLQYLRSV
ncbi:hypothetical protein KFU94_07980 [Chloroflexi bacterium TSY]|nr:hypothetical protein [Chloroflexi bacterium TSY]